MYLIGHYCSRSVTRSNMLDCVCAVGTNCEPFHSTDIATKYCTNPAQGLGQAHVHHPTICKNQWFL